MFYTLHNSTLGQSALPGLTPYDASRGKRVVKDVLRVGKWKAGQKDWHVTADVLKTLANDFAAMQANGVKSNLYWGSRPDGGPMGQHGVVAKDAIAPIDQVIVHDGVLYCSVYVTDDQAKLLANPAHQVSVGVKPNWQDGANKVYSLALLHVAIVDQPVVTHQGPFLMLANTSREGEPMTADEKAAFDKLNDVATKLSEAFIGLSNEFKEFKAGVVAAKANEAKEAWAARLKSLFDAKKINAATLEQYTGLGESVSYNLALLAPLDGVIMLANGSGVEKHANGNPPNVGENSEEKPLTDEQMRARLKARGLNPDLMPTISV